MRIKLLAIPSLAGQQAIKQETEHEKSFYYGQRAAVSAKLYLFPNKQFPNFAEPSKV